MEEFLHYGVKGMRWGIRHDRELKGTKRSKKSKTNSTSASSKPKKLESYTYEEFMESVDPIIRRRLENKTPSTSSYTVHVDLPTTSNGMDYSDFQGHHSSGVKLYKTNYANAKNTVQNWSDDMLLNNLFRIKTSIQDNGGKISYNYRLMKEIFSYADIDIDEIMDGNYIDHLIKTLPKKDEESEEAREKLKDVVAAIEAERMMDNDAWTETSEQDRLADIDYQNMQKNVEKYGLGSIVTPLSIPTENGMVNYYYVKDVKNGKLLKYEPDQFDLMLKDLQRRGLISGKGDFRQVSRSREKYISGEPTKIKKRSMNTDNTNEKHFSPNSKVERFTKQEAAKKRKPPKKSATNVSHSEDVNMKDTLTHYGILGMKWGVRRTPEQLGHAPKSERKAFRKQLKEDEKEYRKNRRAVSATQENLKMRTRAADRAEIGVENAERAYRKALQKRVAPWKREEKERIVQAADKALDKAMTSMETSEAKRRQAHKNAKDAIERMERTISDFSDKYGAENVKQLKTKQIKMIKKGARFYEWSMPTIIEGYKTGADATKIPFIGNMIAANIVNNIERETRQELMDTRANSYSKKKYA